MKTGTVALGNASLHLGYSGIIKPNQRGLVREITEFFVPENQRGNGEGSALLREVCEEADSKAIILILIADGVRLATYYQRFGFVIVPYNDDKPILMARKPTITSLKWIGGVVKKSIARKTVL